MADTKATAEARKAAEAACIDCDHGVVVRGYYGGEFDDGSHACEDCIAKAFEAVLAALREIAAGSPPDDWEPYDRFGDHNGHGKPGDDDYVDEVDPSNSGDVHNHGRAVGRWSAAKIARATLRGNE